MDWRRSCGDRRHADGRATRPMALVAALALVAGIYPDGHWNHATKLTTSNFESFITENVDAGKTAIVRWIASAG